jgi:hypothetical protein
MVADQKRSVWLPVILGDPLFDDRCPESVAQDVAIKSRDRIGRMIFVYDAAPIGAGV